MDVAKNVRLGLRIGLIVATGFSVWVTMVRLALGPGAFERFGLGWMQIIALYYVTLSLGGCAYGVVERFRRHPLGAMLQGFLLVFPMYAAITVAIGVTVEPVIPFKAALIGGVIGAILVGSFVGLWMWIDEKQKAGDAGASDNSDASARDGAGGTAPTHDG